MPAASRRGGARRPAIDRGEGTRPAAGRITLLIVDDHPMWRDTLRKVLEYAGVGVVVGEAGDGVEAVELARRYRPDVVIMDVNLPALGGIEATRALATDNPDVKVLALSSSDEPAHIVEIVKAGASGYLLKTASGDEVAEAVRRVHRGEAVLPPTLSEVVLSEFRRLATGGAAAMRVAIADEAALIREGIARVLQEKGFEVAGHGGTVDQILDLVDRFRLDVVVLDGVLAATETPDGLLASRLRSRGVGVLVLAGDTVDARLATSLPDATAGFGLLHRARVADIDDLAEAIRQVSRGEPVLDPDLVNALVERGQEPDELARLTGREREVLALMAEGRTNQAIGERLYLGQKSVEAYVRNIFMKMGLEMTPDDHRRVLAVLAYLRSS